VLQALVLAAQALVVPPRWCADGTHQGAPPRCRARCA
jgi:hypothetical protein